MKTPQSLLKTLQYLLVFVVGFLVLRMLPSNLVYWFAAISKALVILLFVWAHTYRFCIGYERIFNPGTEDMGR